MWTLWVWLSLGREDFHGEVSYILAAFGVSQEDGLLFCLRGADVPVGVQGRLEFNSVLDFCLVEDESLLHVPLWVTLGSTSCSKAEIHVCCKGQVKDTLL